jgi:lysophospholipase L1-like esterase
LLVLNRLNRTIFIFCASAIVGSAAIVVPPNPAAKKAAAKAVAPQTKQAPTKQAAAKPAATKQAAAKPPAAGTKAAVSTQVKKPVAKTTVRRRYTPVPQVSAKARTAGQDYVFQNVSSGADIPVEHAAALIPFFEQLYRHQKGESQGPVRILHYGDSHTAADEWTGAMRAHFQEKFGDGGAGYSYAGRPWTGYRRLDVRTSSTRGWHSDGLVGRPGDGIYGLGGVSMSTRSPREAVYLDADAASFELFYLQQPGGGSVQIMDNGIPLERISTAGEPTPAYYHFEGVPGPHKLEVETLDPAPVRLFGWVAEKNTGVTYETLGINGASASIVMDWNEETLRSNIARRDPALIVLAYGTNEASRKDLTMEAYRDMFIQLIGRFRNAAPTATILVIGPPDRSVRTRLGWQGMDGIDKIVEAQRLAAEATGCPFWDMRAKMGGKGSMEQWVNAGMAQYDHVHFTTPGYKMMGDAIFRDLMSQYDVFLKARADILAENPPAQAPKVAPASESAGSTIETAQQ